MKGQTQTVPGSRGALLASTLLLGVVGACASVTETDAGNSEQAMLYFTPAPQDCASGATRADVSCIDHPCWVLGVRLGTHRLSVQHRVRIADCGGVGDCLSDIEYRPVEPSASFTVSPVLWA